MPYFRLTRVLAMALVLSCVVAANVTPRSWAQTETKRKAKTTVTPNYPELARHMNISGVVKVQVTVAPDGSVKDTHVLGGHPVLVNAALDAARRCRFEAGSESKEILEFRFSPNE
jgi:TonB family protein